MLRSSIISQGVVRANTGIELLVPGDEWCHGQGLGPLHKPSP